MKKVIVKDKEKTTEIRYFPDDIKAYDFATSIKIEQMEMPEIPERHDVFLLPHKRAFHPKHLGRAIERGRDYGKFLEYVDIEHQRERKKAYKKGWEIY